MTKLEYHITQPMAASARRDAVLQMKGQVTMADYHFRVNVERFGVDLKSVTTRIHWDRGAGVECRFEIEAPASEETLSMALDDAVRLIGLRAQRLLQELGK